ncbi:MAG: ABC transporter ATP-binding protein [Candidatus Hodarchaeales archaeon]|jgi:ABC-type multidrug transport system fused ATPase/permease subunit
MIPPAQRWILKQLFYYKRLLFLSTLGAVVDIILFSLPPLIVAEVIRELFGEGSTKVIFFWLMFFLILAFIQTSHFFMAGYYNEVLAHRVTTDITALLFSKLQSRSLTYLDKFDLGEIMARATNDTRQLNIGLSPAYRLIIQSILQAFIIAGMLWWFEPRFIFFLIFIIPYIWLNFHYLRRIYPKQKKLLTDFEKISIISNETFTGIQELKSFTAEEKFSTLFEDRSREHAKTLYERGKIQAFYYPVLLFWVFVGIVALTGVFWIIDGSLGIPEFAGALGAFLMFRFLAEALSWATTESVAAVAASNRLFNVIFEEEDFRQQHGNIPFDRNNIKIEFDNVWFRYSNDSEWSLRNLSFNVDLNSTVVLVGAPGSGKSSINKLIQRLYSPTKGSIRIGGHPIQNYDKTFLNHVATIEQSPFLFSDTILNNLLFGKPNATIEELEKASQLAEAFEFIDLFPKRFETEIGDRGVKLSGGQRQRLAIARALLLNPAILIMDDASSALDAKTEMAIQRSIMNILKTRTAIITSHRLAIISQADNIILLDEGKIIAQGTHNKLITTTPEYRRLFEHHYELPPLIKPM